MSTTKCWFYLSSGRQCLKEKDAKVHATNTREGHPFIPIRRSKQKTGNRANRGTKS